MFNIKRIDIGNFGNGIVPEFELTNLNIETIHNGINKTQVEKQKKLEENKKRLKTSNDIIASINRRFNKFKYAYYNKGVERMDKEKITKCYNKTRQFAATLQHMHRKLLASDDPRAEKFGKKVEEANKIVQKYGAYVMRLNQTNCAKPIKKVQWSRNKVRK